MPWAEIAQVSFARMHFVQPSPKLVTTDGRTFWIARVTKDVAGLYPLRTPMGAPRTR